MHHFTEFVGKSSEELIREAKEEQLEGLDMDERKIRSYLNRFRKDMLEIQKLALLTVRTRLVGVRSFYSSFYVETPKLKRISKAKPQPKNVREIPTKEDIHDVLKYCDKLERALVLLAALQG